MVYNFDYLSYIQKKRVLRMTSSNGPDKDIFSAELTKNIGFSNDEMQDIQSEIDNMVQSNKLTVEPDYLKPSPSRSGLRFPLILNGILFAVLGVVFGVFFALTNNRQDMLVQEAQTFVSTEAQLIKELVRQSERELADREAQISSIQGELSEISSALQLLEQDFDSQVQSRRATLQAEFEATLEAQREQLESENYTSEEVQTLLNELQGQAQERIENEIALFESQLALETRVRETELVKLRTSLEEDLASGQSQITQLQSSLARSEEELLEAVASGEETISELETQLAINSGLEEEYLSLLDQQESEAVLVAQVDAAYQEVFNLITAGSFGASQARLSRLEALVRGIDNSTNYTRGDLDIRTIQIIREYVDLEEVNRQQQEELINVTAVAEDLATANQPLIERFLTLQREYQDAVNRSQSFQDPAQAKQALLSVFNEYEEEFPNFLRIVSSFDEAIVDGIASTNQRTITTLEARARAQEAAVEREVGRQARNEAISDSYDVVQAALGDPEKQGESRALLNSDSTLSTIYELIQEALSAETIVSSSSGQGARNPSIPQVELPFIGNVTGTFGRREFTFNNIAGVAIRLGTEVTVYRNFNSSAQLIGRAVVNRTDKDQVQAVLRNGEGSVSQGDSIFLSR